MSTSAVGIYPSGASPYGVLDMAGNVWEWCTDNYDQREKDVHAPKVVRGGSWNNTQGLACASYRSDSLPVNRDFNFGFRVVCVSPIR
jgi:formylglycine-generating enzyme required for sulfatase activity